MPKPTTPLVGCDTFILNKEDHVLLIRRSDSDLWALPGGFNDLGETPAECAARESLEETGYKIEIEKILGVFSSNRYDYVHYKWKDNEIVHILFSGTVISGLPKTSDETREIKWFAKDTLPELFDGHQVIIEFGFKKMAKPETPPYFE